MSSDGEGLCCVENVDEIRNEDVISTGGCKSWQVGDERLNIFNNYSQV